MDPVQLVRTSSVQLVRTSCQGLSLDDLRCRPLVLADNTSQQRRCLIRQITGVNTALLTPVTY